MANPVKTALLLSDLSATTVTKTPQKQKNGSVITPSKCSLDDSVVILRSAKRPCLSKQTETSTDKLLSPALYSSKSNLVQTTLHLPDLSTTSSPYTQADLQSLDPVPDDASPISSILDSSAIASTFETTSRYSSSVSDASLKEVAKESDPVVEDKAHLEQHAQKNNINLKRKHTEQILDEADTILSSSSNTCLPSTPMPIDAINMPALETIEPDRSALIGKNISVTLPTEKPPIKVAAYIKYKHLINGTSSALDTPSKPAVIHRRELPSHLELLQKTFEALEKVHDFTTARDQRCIYHKIRRAVENYSNRSFELSHLAQIMYIYPEAYNLQAVRTVHDGASVSSILIESSKASHDANQSIFEALVQPSKNIANSMHLPPCIQGKQQENTPLSVSRRTICPETRSIDDFSTHKRLIMAASMLESRLLTFRRRLEDWVDTTHNAFLDADPRRKIEMEGLCGIPQWHSQFDLSTVPELPMAALPEPELTHFQKLWKKRGGCDMPGVATSLTGASFQGLNEQLAKKLAQKIKAHSETTEKKELGSKTSIDTPNYSELSLASNDPSETVESNNGTPTKKISRAAAIVLKLKEKNRLKAEKEKANPTPSAETIKRIEMLKRLPSIAQALNIHYSSTKKVAMPLPMALSYLTDGFAHHNLSANDIYDHVMLLVDVAPNFCQIVVSEGKQVLKLLTTHKPMEVVREAIRNVDSNKSKILNVPSISK
ncbi:hypothetical protein BDEG_21333 [Batrachochytrium dendrobatidis JEL423]|nr:hypothetical protein BDEG_21333 [Batrachochytrium dendrobatidis JEL423]